MKIALFIFFSFFGFSLLGQSPIYDFISFNEGLNVPKDLNSERSVVIFSVPDKINEFKKVGDYESMISKIHHAFVKMGVDVVLYVSELNLTASHSALLSYVEIFNNRRIKNIIFVTQKNEQYELLMAPFSENKQFINEGANVFYMKKDDLHTLLLNVGREIRRADQPLKNFLIPEKPTYLQGISIVEKTLLKNYPGILRRSKLAVERFTYLDTTNITDSKILNRVKVYNEEIKQKNMELEQIITAYPYEYELIDPMTDDEMKRKRYQFLLRSVRSSAKSVKQMLNYDVLPSETDFVSVIPVMPDQTRTKSIPKDALVYKFYVRQNISLNVHVGEWDADITWQEALNNMIGNLTQELRTK